MTQPLDRSHTSTLLAKVHAHLATNDEDSARTYARMLVRALADAGLIGKTERTVLTVRA